MLRNLLALSLVIAALGLFAAQPGSQTRPQAQGACVPLTDADRTVLDAVAQEIRAALRDKVTEAEIRARVAAAQGRLVSRGAVRCMTDGSGVQPAVAQHGALAVGPGGAWGVSWDQPTPDAAATRARSECGARCAIVVRVAGPQCGAYATYGSASGWGIAATAEDAQSRAVAECSARAGRRCSVRVWGCNSRIR